MAIADPGNLLIAGGRLVDAELGLDELRDVRIANGRVVELGNDLRPLPGERAFDASGAIVVPGLVDMHVHLREPGFPEKETIETGTQAALRGGFTSIACMPNTEPALDSPQTLRALASELARRASCRVYPIAAITIGRRGERPCDFAALAAAGAVAFSDDGNSVGDLRVLYDAALHAAAVRGPFISHCEDAALKGEGVMNEGPVSHALGVPASPALAEDAIVARDLLVAQDSGKAWHVAHLSTARGLEFVEEARVRGTRVTCEVTPHHLWFTDEAVASLGAAAKVNPPLRTQADVAALRAGVLDGHVDVFATDHAPHTAREKSGDLRAAAVGFTGLEIAVGAYATALPDLSVSRFVALASTNPARILGIPGGTLAPGSPGDVAILADRPWTVDPAGFASKGRCTPFAGKRLTRRVLATVLGGVVAYELTP